jgi:hypothetical protein
MRASGGMAAGGGRGRAWAGGGGLPVGQGSEDEGGMAAVLVPDPWAADQGETVRKPGSWRGCGKILKRLNFTWLESGWKAAGIRLAIFRDCGRLRHGQGAVGVRRLPAPTHKPHRTPAPPRQRAGAALGGAGVRGGLWVAAPDRRDLRGRRGRRPTGEGVCCGHRAIWKTPGAARGDPDGAQRWLQAGRGARHSRAATASSRDVWSRRLIPPAIQVARVT